MLASRGTILLLILLHVFLANPSPINRSKYLPLHFYSSITQPNLFNKVLCCHKSLLDIVSTNPVSLEFLTLIITSAFYSHRNKWPYNHQHLDLLHMHIGSHAGQGE